MIKQGEFYVVMARVVVDSTTIKSMGEAAKVVQARLSLGFPWGYCDQVRMAGPDEVAAVEAEMAASAPIRSPNTEESE